jgi:hypothetical protein
MSRSRRERFWRWWNLGKVTDPRVDNPPFDGRRLFLGLLVWGELLTVYAFTHALDYTRRRRRCVSGPLPQQRPLNSAWAADEDGSEGGHGAAKPDSVIQKTAKVGCTCPNFGESFPTPLIHPTFCGPPDKGRQHTIVKSFARCLLFGRPCQQLPL